MRLLFALLLLTMMPALGSAQSSSAANLPQIAQPQAPEGQQQALGSWWIGVSPPTADNHSGAAFPLWSTPDGRILAIVGSATNTGAPVTQPAPHIGTAVDWKLVDVTSFVTGGFAFKIGDGSAAYAKFGRGIVLAPLLPNTACNPLMQITPSAACAARVAANAGTASAGVQLAADSADIDVSYGLSWLHNDPQTLRQPWDLFPGSGDGALPTLLIPGYTLANMQNMGVSAQSHLRLDDGQTLDLGAALGRIQYELPGMAPLPNLNQAALSFGLHKGDFSGQIVGRVLGPGDPLNNGQRWSSIDLGISWRAPWRGVFSVGAQNLWSSGSLPSLAEPSHEVDPSQARVPYVQYHQDL
jgi:hypothetical protein